jgi:hypothetical protein
MLFSYSGNEKLADRNAKRRRCEAPASGRDRFRQRLRLF